MTKQEREEYERARRKMESSVPRIVRTPETNAEAQARERAAVERAKAKADERNAGK